MPKGNKLAEINAHMEVLLGDIEELLSRVKKNTEGAVFRAKGGPGSGEKDDHPFRGNQYVTADGTGANPDEATGAKISDDHLATLSSNAHIALAYDRTTQGKVAEVAKEVSEGVSKAMSTRKLSQTLALGDVPKGGVFDDTKIDLKANAVAIVTTSYAGLLTNLATKFVQHENARMDMALTFAEMVLGADTSVAAKLYEKLSEEVSRQDLKENPPDIVALARVAMEATGGIDKFVSAVNAKADELRDASIIHMTGSMGALTSMLNEGIHSNVDLVDKLNSSLGDLQLERDRLEDVISRLSDTLDKKAGEWADAHPEELRGMNITSGSGTLSDRVYEELSKNDPDVARMVRQLEDLHSDVTEIGNKENAINVVMGHMHTYDEDRAAGLDRYVFSSFEHTEASTYGEFGMVLKTDVVGKPGTWATTHDIAGIGGGKNQYGEYSGESIGKYLSSVVNDGGLLTTSAVRAISEDWKASSDPYAGFDKPEDAFKLSSTSFKGQTSMEVKIGHVSPDEVEAVIVPNRDYVTRASESFKGPIIYRDRNPNNSDGFVFYLHGDPKPLLESDRYMNPTKAITLAIREYKRRKREAKSG